MMFWVQDNLELSTEVSTDELLQLEKNVITYIAIFVFVYFFFLVMYNDMTFKSKPFLCCAFALMHILTCLVLRRFFW